MIIAWIYSHGAFAVEKIFKIVWQLQIHQRAFHEMSTKNFLCCNYRFTNLKKCLDSKHIVCTDPSYNCKWLYTKKDYQTLIWWSTSGGAMVSMLDEQTYTSEFNSHWVPNSCCLVLHLSKKLSKLAWWSYHYHLPKFTCTMLVRV